MCGGPNPTTIGLKEPRISGRSRQERCARGAGLRFAEQICPQPMPSSPPSKSPNTPYCPEAAQPTTDCFAPVKIPPFTVLKFICSFISFLFILSTYCVPGSLLRPRPRAANSVDMLSREKGQAVTGARVEGHNDFGPPWPPPGNVHLYLTSVPLSSLIRKPLPRIPTGLPSPRVSATSQAPSMGSWQEVGSWNCQRA